MLKYLLLQLQLENMERLPSRETSLLWGKQIKKGFVQFLSLVTQWELTNKWHIVLERPGKHQGDQHYVGVSKSVNQLLSSGRLFFPDDDDIDVMIKYKKKKRAEESFDRKKKLGKTIFDSFN